MSKTKTREITIVESQGAFSILTKSSKKYDFAGISALRQLLSKERAKTLHVIKTQKPSSLYELAKKTGRNFKSVSDDVKLLQRFGLLELVEDSFNGRKRLRPVLISERINIVLNI